MNASATYREHGVSSLLACVAVFAFIFVMFLSLSGEGLFRDPDLFWHIVVGRKIIESGSFPVTDELSHTFYGQRWIAKEWLSQIILALAHAAGSWKGVVAVAGCAVALTFALLLHAMLQHLRLVPALIITIFAYSLASPHFLARPHVLSYPLIVIWVAGLTRAADARAAPSFLLLPVMILWSNLHAGFTLGLALVIPIAIEAILATDMSFRRQLLVRWLAFWAAAVVASLLTPYGYYSIYVTYQLIGKSEALNHIAEWRAFDLSRELSAGPLLLIALFLCLLNGVKFPLMRCLSVMGMIYLALKHVRFIALAAITLPILIASSLAAQFPYIRRRRDDPAFDVVDAAARKPWLVSLILLFSAVAVSASAYLPERQPKSSITPVAAVDFIAERAKTERVYNPMLFGGYLAFRGIPTFIDGRNDQLFGGGFMTELFTSLEGTGREFLQILDRFNASLALVPPGSADAERLDAASGWRRIYADEFAVVYERKH
jgi:hypothetical protein